jgi:CheY-like chemotaxis protein
VPAPAASGKRILIVDDNRDVADLLVEALGAKGHVTQAAYDGPTALAVAEIFRPEIGILDIGLPVMDGYELSIELRRRFGDALKLVALTGYGQAHDLKRSKEVGFRKHLVKPVPLEQLTAIIEGLGDEAATRA